MDIWFKLFLSFNKIGFFGFGGGIAMLPIIFETAKLFGIDDPREFSNLVAISQITPGPLAVNAATYVGYYTEGLTGALAATMGVAIPSFILVIAVSYFVERFKTNSLIQGALAGVRPITAGLIGAAGYFMALDLINEPNWVLGGVVLGTTIMNGKFKVNPFFLIVGGGIIGAIAIR